MNIPTALDLLDVAALFTSEHVRIAQKIAGQKFFAAALLDLEHHILKCKETADTHSRSRRSEKMALRAQCLKIIEDYTPVLEELIRVRGRLDIFRGLEIHNERIRQVWAA